MKKALSFFALLVIIIANCNAQDYRHRAGLHMGYGFSSYYTEGCFEYDFDDKHRIGAMAGAANFYNIHKEDLAYAWSFSAGGSFNWVGNISDNTYWFIGPAAMVFVGNVVDFAFGLHLGAEYRFSSPLRLGIDFRPLFSITPLSGNYFDSPVFLSLKWSF